MRREALLRMFSETLEEHVASGLPKETWQHKYKLMGQTMCFTAFCQLTGISSYAITQARDGALKKKRSSSSRGELPMHMAILGTSKPKLYIDARSWLAARR